jgi:argininosuccinate lyase
MRNFVFAKVYLIFMEHSAFDERKHYEEIHCWTSSEVRKSLPISKALKTGRCQQKKVVTDMRVTPQEYI